jgi:hypothetical protein
MRISKNLIVCRLWLARSSLVGGLVLLAAYCCLVTRAQQPPARLNVRKVTSDELFKSPAKLIYEGTNTVATGRLKLKTFRLERVSLPNPLDVSIRGKKHAVESVLRLTVTGEAFQQGSYTISIGDRSLTDVMRDPTQLVTVIYDRSLLADGATISVTYETPDNPVRTVLPEQLYIPAELGQASVDNRDDVAVTGMRKVGNPGGRSVIEIELTGEEVFGGRNSQQIFQIGTFESYGDNSPDGDAYKWIIRLPIEVFENLEDGSPILIKQDRGKNGLRSARMIAHLYKTMLGK